MTLSNFDWTDKTSVKWFIMLPTGHEGPYSLDVLLKRKISHEMKVWAEGLSVPVTLKVALQNSQVVAAPKMEPVEEEIPPPLPPLPEADEEEKEDSLPPVPQAEDEILEEPQTTAPEKKRFKLLGVVLGALIVLVLGLREWTRSQQEFSIRRLPKMSPQLFAKINSDFKFEGWDKKIFFKEYVPVDMSHIWLVTSGFQNCEIEAQFSSLKGKLLAKDEPKVSFKTSTILTGHFAEFSHFEFTSGNKIIPGLYEMDLRANNCRWDTLAAKMGNWFAPPEENYVTRMKVVLYNKGSVEFNALLDKLIRKKLDQQLKNQNQEELFWQDLQQKMQTLLAISLQIEQLLLEFLESPPSEFNKKLKPMVDKYTKNFGHFLTNFVVANEQYFRDLEKSALNNMSSKRGYESMVKVSSKRIGFESMKIIEDLQAMKKPSRKDLQSMETRVKNQFQELKDLINSKIIQITEDRVN